METTPIVVAVAIAVGIAVYLLPAILAGIRGHASAWGIFALNLLLGWSGISLDHRADLGLVQQGSGGAADGRRSQQW